MEKNHKIKAAKTHPRINWSAYSKRIDHVTARRINWAQSFGRESRNIFLWTSITKAAFFPHLVSPFCPSAWSYCENVFSSGYDRNTPRATIVHKHNLLVMPAANTRDKLRYTVPTPWKRAGIHNGHEVHLIGRQLYIVRSTVRTTSKASLEVYKIVRNLSDEIYLYLLSP